MSTSSVASNSLVIFKLMVIVVLAIAVYIALKRLLNKAYDSGHLSQNNEFLLRTGIRWGVVLIAVVMGVQTFGISVQAAWTALSAVLVLVAVGFVATWSILSNVLSAFLLVAFAPFRIGDRIEVLEVVNRDPEKAGISGVVKAIDLMYTTLETEEEGIKSEMRIPNNLLLQRAVRTIPGSETEQLVSSMLATGAQGENAERR